MKLVRYKGELWTTGTESHNYTFIYWLHGARFDVVFTRDLELVGNNYRPTATATKGCASSVHDTKGCCRK